MKGLTLKNELKRFIEKHGMEYFQAACPYCGMKELYPTHPSMVRGKQARLDMGKRQETKFEQMWKLRYEKDFGEIVYKDTTPYASYADYFNRQNKLHFEIKKKVQELYLIETELGGDVYVNKASADSKMTLKKQNPSHTYAFVEYFQDEGYYAVPVEQIVVCLPKSMVGSSGSGDPAYSVPIGMFEPFDRFMQALVK